MWSTIFLIWFVSFVVFFSILYLYDLHKKSEYFVEEQIYVAKLRLIEMFDTYLGRNPSDSEIKEYLKIRDKDRIIDNLKKDYPDEFLGHKENDANETNDDSNEMDITTSMNSDVSRLSDLLDNSKQLEKGEGEGEGEKKDADISSYSMFSDVRRLSDLQERTR